MSRFVVRQEPDDVASARLVRISVVSLVVGAIGVFFAGVILESTTGAMRPDFAGPGGPQSAPRAISSVEQASIWDTKTGIDLREAQLRDLESWGWVDRKQGIAKIPISQAMDIVEKAGSR